MRYFRVLYNSSTFKKSFSIINICEISGKFARNFFLCDLLLNLCCVYRQYSLDCCRGEPCSSSSPPPVHSLLSPQEAKTPTGGGGGGQLEVGQKRPQPSQARQFSKQQSPTQIHQSNQPSEASHSSRLTATAPSATCRPHLGVYTVTPGSSSTINRTQPPSAPSSQPVLGNPLLKSSSASSPVLIAGQMSSNLLSASRQSPLLSSSNKTNCQRPRIITASPVEAKTLQPLVTDRRRPLTAVVPPQRSPLVPPQQSLVPSSLVPQQQSQPVLLQQQPTLVQPLIRPQQLPHVPQHQQQQPLVVPPPQQQQQPPPLVHESERKSVLRRGRNPNTSQQDRKVSQVILRIFA